MSALLAGALLLVAACSGARVLRLEDHGAPTAMASSPLDVELWHAVMGLSMAAMLLTSVPAWLSRLATVVFGCGLLWSALRLLSPAARTAYLRLGACCAAMVAMLAPAAVAVDTGSTSMARMTGAAGMAGMRMGDVTSTTLPPVLVAGLLVALGVVVVGGSARLARVGGRGAGPVVMLRMQAAGEVVMTGAMAWMLVGLV